MRIFHTLKIRDHKRPFLALILTIAPAFGQFFGGAPVQVVGTLPSRCNIGQLYQTSSDGKLYSCTSTGYTRPAQIVAASQLSTPSTPIAQATGGTGPAHYKYQVVAYAADGTHTDASVISPNPFAPHPETVLNGVGLNGTTRYNLVSFIGVPGAAYCRVYQTSNDFGQDIGLVQDATSGLTDIPCDLATYPLGRTVKDGGTYNPIGGTPATANTTGRFQLGGGTCSTDAPSGSICTAGNVELLGAKLRGGGATLPATCTVGDLYFLSAGSVGYYSCTATDTWTLPAGGNSTAPVVATFSAPSTCSSSGGTGTNSCTFSSGTTLTVTHNLGTTQPWAACYDGSGNMLGSTGASTSVTSVVATSSNVATITFSGSTSGTCAISTGGPGPIGATGPAPTITTESAGANCTYGGTKIVSGATTRYVCNGAPGTGDVSTGGTNTYTSSAVNDARAAAHTLPAKTGLAASKPATCTTGEEYFATDSAAGQNKWYCTATNTWTQQAGSSYKYITVPLRFYHNAFASSTTSHFYQGIYPPQATIAGSNNSSFKVEIPVTGTIVQARVQGYNGANSTSPGGDTTIALCINGTAAGNAACNGTAVNLYTGNMAAQFASVFARPSLSTAVTAGDYVTIDVVAGTFTTSATFAVYVDLVIQW